jgi:hypothetical protein
MWRLDPHSLNPEILHSHVEIFISDLISCLYKVRFIRNYGRNEIFFLPKRFSNFINSTF